MGSPPCGKRPGRAVQGQSRADVAVARYVIVIVDVDETVPGGLREDDEYRQHEQTADGRSE